MKTEDFERLVKNLKYWNESEEGIDSHGTAAPIFEVQEKIKVYGFDSEYADKWVFIYEDSEFDTVKEVLETFEDCDSQLLCTMEDCGSIKSFMELPEYRQINAILDSGLGFNQVYYKEEWKHVNTHLTREAAQAFIDRKQHDHGELKIYINSLYWCWEFKELIKGLINGEIMNVFGNE